MQGFFKNKTTTQQSIRRSLSCVACGLYKEAHTPRMAAQGQGARGIVNIGHSPTTREDAAATVWQGAAGRLLRAAYKRIGVDVDHDCANLNAVNCTTHGATATPHQIDCCRAVKVDPFIRENAPRVIVLFGNEALFSFMGRRWARNLDTIRKWHGMAIPDQDYRAWVVPVWHPDFVVSSRGGREIETIWNKDFDTIKRCLDTPLPRYKKPRIEIIEDLSVLNSVQASIVAFDYETTGLKPHATGHRIVSASVAVDEDTAYSFLMPTTKRARQPFIDLLQNKLIGKMAHNMKFEDTWSRVRLRTTVENWAWDSMLAAHLLDNRPGITSLKFQTYVRLGIIDYESSIGGYLKSIETKNANSLNRITELMKTKQGVEDLLYYNGLDSVYEYRVAMQQIKELNYDFLPF